ncbi:MAG TPA: hypothetical protein VGR59_06335 [Gemmatimonadaceae bacterium]|nr:hypothetical protein [Gemmatimonadaceae bacterium]
MIACLVRHLVCSAVRRAQRALGLAVCAAAATACIDSLTTAPTTSHNARLIAHFDSLSVVSSPAHASQLSDIVIELAQGAAVAHVNIELGSGEATYSVVARYEIIDDAGTPVDSDLIVSAWHGDDADTIVSLEFVRDSVFAQLTTPDSLFSATVAGAATPSDLHGTCASFVSALPPGIFVPPALSCQYEKVGALATGKLTTAGDSTVDFALPGQTFSAIRYEFNEQVP